MDIGSIDAETDEKYLNQAFVDLGWLDRIRDTTDPKCILVGRTGTGKTALLLRLESVSQRVIRIRPEALSLQYLSNSTILPALTALGIRLDLFYKLLWRHVFVVEIIRDFYEVRDKSSQAAFFRKIAELVSPAQQRRRRAVEYFTNWGSKFWVEAEERVREIVEVLESRLSSELGSDLDLLKAGAAASETESIQKRTEVVARAQKIIQQIQIQDLNEALDVVREEPLADSQNPYYLVIDDLDKEWVEHSYAYDLIEALIEEAGEFAKIANVKVVVALRENIVEQLNERGSSRRGRQREKHENLFLRLRWGADELERVADARIREAVKGWYGGVLTLTGLFPPARHKDRMSGVEYMLARTFARPRDLIRFVNLCFDKAVGENRVTWATIAAVTPKYSRERLQSVVDEWQENYVEIEKVIDGFRGIQDGFRVQELPTETLIAVITAGEQGDDPRSLPGQIAALEETDRAMNELLVTVLYRISCLGAKLPKQKVVFSYEEPLLLMAGVPPETKFYFHPALYEALNVRDPAVTA